jgi:hypothetical protein
MKPNYAYQQRRLYRNFDGTVTYKTKDGDITKAVKTYIGYKILAFCFFVLLGFISGIIQS